MLLGYDASAEQGLGYAIRSDYQRRVQMELMNGDKWSDGHATNSPSPETSKLSTYSIKRREIVFDGDQVSPYVKYAEQLWGYRCAVLKKGSNEQSERPLGTDILALLDRACSLTIQYGGNGALSLRSSQNSQKNTKRRSEKSQRGSEQRKVD